MNDQLKTLLNKISKNHQEFTKSLSETDIDTILTELSEDELLTIARELHDQASAEQQTALKEILSLSYTKTQSTGHSFWNLLFKNQALFSLIAIAAIGLGFYSLQPRYSTAPDAPEYSVTDEQNWQISVNQVALTEDSKLVSLTLVTPKLAIGNEVVDIHWTVEGTETLYYRQEQITLDDSQLQIELPQGTYNLTAIITYQGQEIVVKEELEV